MSKRAPNRKSELKADIRGMRQLIRDMDALLNGETHWPTWYELAGMARDLEAGASSFATYAYENGEQLESEQQ